MILLMVIYTKGTSKQYTFDIEHRMQMQSGTTHISTDKILIADDLPMQNYDNITVSNCWNVRVAACSLSVGYFVLDQ